MWPTDKRMMGEPTFCANDEVAIDDGGYMRGQGEGRAGDEDTCMRTVIVKMDDGEASDSALPFGDGDVGEAKFDALDEIEVAESARDGWSGETTIEGGGHGTVHLGCRACRRGGERAERGLDGRRDALGARGR